MKAIAMCCACLWFSPAHVIHFRITLKIFMDHIIFDVSFDFIFPRSVFPSFFYFFFIVCVDRDLKMQQPVAHSISGAVCRSDCACDKILFET